MFHSILQCLDTTEYTYHLGGDETGHVLLTDDKTVGYTVVVVETSTCYETWNNTVKVITQICVCDI